MVYWYIGILASQPLALLARQRTVSIGKATYCNIDRSTCIIGKTKLIQWFTNITATLDSRSENIFQHRSLKTLDNKETASFRGQLFCFQTADTFLISCFPWDRATWQLSQICLRNYILVLSDAVSCPSRDCCVSEHARIYGRALT